MSCFKKPNQAGTGDSQPVTNRSTGVVNTGAEIHTEPDFSSHTSPARPVPADRSENLYVALYNYSARTGEDLSFNTGDTLEALDTSTGDWWFAKAVTGISASKQGYIPANYVAPVQSIDAEP